MVRCSCKEGYIMVNKSNKDFQFFVDNYNSLYAEYGHKFIAIKNQSVLGVFDSMAEALNEVTKTEEPGSFIVQECTGDPSAYTSSIMSLCIA